MRLDLYKQRVAVRGVPRAVVPALTRLFRGTLGRVPGTALLPLRAAWACQHFYPDVSVGDELAQRLTRYRETVGRHLSPHLWDFQRQYVQDIVGQGRFGVFSDAGSGKTTILLECARHCGRSVIITPPHLVEDAYLPDARRWYPHLQVVDTTELAGEQRDAALRGAGDVFFVSPYVLGSVVSTLRDVPWGFIGFDESAALRKRDTKLAREARGLARCAPFRAIASANPAPNGIWEFWPQITFLDEEVLGDWISFAKTYSSGRTKWPPYYVFQDATKSAAALNKIKHVSRAIPQRVFWKTRPDLHIIPKLVDLNGKQEAVYRAELAEKRYRIRELPEDLREAEVRAEQIMALREITAGFRYRGAKRVEWLGGAKAQAIHWVLRHHRREQVIIWCEFEAEYALMARVLSRWRVSYAEFTGRGSSRESRDALRAFKAKHVRCLVTNPQSAAHGLRLDHCRVSVFHSLTYNADTFYQAIRRTYRPPQKKDVYVYLLIARQTIDEAMYRAQRKREGWRAVCEEVLA